jgi:hypothetical protein
MGGSRGSMHKPQPLRRERRGHPFRDPGPNEVEAF